MNVELRRCLCEPIPEIEIAAQRLNDAVSAHLRGERDVAEELLRLADDKIVWGWLNWSGAKRAITIGDAECWTIQQCFHRTSA